MPAFSSSYCDINHVIHTICLSCQQADSVIVLMLLTGWFLCVRNHNSNISITWGNLYITLIHEQQQDAKMLLLAPDTVLWNIEKMFMFSLIIPNIIQQYGFSKFLNRGVGYILEVLVSLVSWINNT